MDLYVRINELMDLYVLMNDAVYDFIDLFTLGWVSEYLHNNCKLFQSRLRF